MADISQIKLPDNNTYNFKDTVARGVKMYYGICTTAAATAAKVVTVSADQDFKLTVGALVMVKFTISNTASSVTLNVNSTGAKSIYYNNAVYTGTSTSVCGYANTHFVYMYDGTNWVWVSHSADSNTTYSAMSVAEGQTATATNARSMRSDYLKQIIQYHAVPSGQGVPAGGTAGQVLAKVDGTDYNTEWITPSGGGGIEWETVQYEEEKTIPTESFYWHIPNASKKTPSSTNLELMPFLQALGRGTLGGDIYFKREYYDNNTAYMDTMIFVSTSYTQPIIFHHQKNDKWVNEPVKWAEYSISAAYNSGTGEYDFTLSTSTLTLTTPHPVWFKTILVNGWGIPDVYIALTTNTLVTSGSTIYTPKPIQCKMDLISTNYQFSTATAIFMDGTIKPMVSCNRSGYDAFVDYLLSIHFSINNSYQTSMSSYSKIKLS